MILNLFRIFYPHPYNAWLDILLSIANVMMCIAISSSEVPSITAFLSLLSLAIYFYLPFAYEHRSKRVDTSQTSTKAWNVTIMFVCPAIASMAALLFLTTLGWMQPGYVTSYLMGYILGCMSSYGAFHLSWMLMNLKSWHR
jgi:uncharacterized membrane protein